ncbi:MAG: type II secretion system protein [Victivallaceae bacterium]
MKRCFTILELIVTISIIAIVLALAVGRIGKVPGVLALRNQVDHVRKTMVSARVRAVASGIKQTVVFHREDNKFFIEDANGGVNSANAEYHVPKDINIVLSNRELAPEDDMTYFFYPDGTVEGYDLLFNSAKYSLALKFSKLTGNISIEEQEPNP